MKKSSERNSVRKYNKSELPRLRWTPELHQHFVQAIQSLGGKHKATPKLILQQMRVKGLRIAHIKSHLQMYRNMKGHTMIAPSNQFLEGNVNDFEICSICPTERFLKRELHLLENKDGLSLTQISDEETEYDLNQEPQSSALLSDDVSNEDENCGVIKFPDMSFSFSMMHAENSQKIMSFSSSTAAANHFVHSSSTPSFGNNYINLDLTI